MQVERQLRAAAVSAALSTLALTRSFVCKLVAACGPTFCLVAHPVLLISFSARQQCKTAKAQSLFRLCEDPQLKRRKPCRKKSAAPSQPTSSSARLSCTRCCLPLHCHAQTIVGCIAHALACYASVSARLLQVLRAVPQASVRSGEAGAPRLVLSVVRGTMQLCGVRAHARNERTSGASCSSGGGGLARQTCTRAGWSSRLACLTAQERSSGAAAGA